MSAMALFIRLSKSALGDCRAILDGVSAIEKGLGQSDDDSVVVCAIDQG
jgi:hypothetical protein